MKKNSRKLRKINTPVKEENEIKNFIIIVAIIVIIGILVYVVTEMVNKPKAEEEPKAAEVNYDILSIGTMLNAPYENYYVLIYNSEDVKVSQYSTLLSTYKQNKNTDGYKKIYYIDLNNALNSKYYNINNDGKSNTKAQKISELNLGDLTLIEVKNSKIINYIESYEQIKNLLTK